MNALILFDIDATMVTTGGLGVRAMGLAGKQLFGDEFTTDGLDFAGRIDPLLVRELFANNRVARTPEAERAFRAAYGRHLASLFDRSSLHTALPGVGSLLDRLGDGKAGVLGVLTGNFAETGTLKLERCGIDPAQFAVAAWGDESPHEPPARDHLPAVALGRFVERFGRAVEPGRVTIIGDTPHDVRCARVHGCRSLAVATGKFSVEELERSGADRVVPDLTRTDDVVRWLDQDIPR